MTMLLEVMLLVAFAVVVTGLLITAVADLAVRWTDRQADQDREREKDRTHRARTEGTMVKW